MSHITHMTNLGKSDQYWESRGTGILVGLCNWIVTEKLGMPYDATKFTQVLLKRSER